MKSFVSVSIRRVVFLVVVVCVFGTAALGQPWFGSGTEGDPYLIYDACDMQAIGANSVYWDAHFNLMADIDLGSYTGTSFNIIGGYGNPFTGVFDGKGHTISNFTYNSDGVACIGLFGYVDEPNAQVRNLALADPNINAGSGICVGALVGVLAEGNVFMCRVDEGNVRGADYVGGLVGGNGNLGESKKGTISDCYAAVIVSGRNEVGGLLGVSVGTVSACYAAGVVDGNEQVGGLVGKNWTGTIFESYSSADVSGSFRVGGLIGNNGYEPQLHGSGSVSNSYALGSVVGTDQVGGLAGINDGIIYYCYSAGGVSGNTDVGGLVGVNQDAYVIDSFWDWQSSGQVSSSGGTGKTTAEMQTESTFTDAGWDFVGEVINGPNDVWTICEGEDYPRLAWEKYGGGNGTEANPYLIRTSCQMNAIGADSNDWDAHFKLMADIDLGPYTGTSFNIIGTDNDNPFRGVFDGNGHTISNFTYNSTGTDRIGLFGYVRGSSAEIKDLGLMNPDVDAGTGDWVGALIGLLRYATVNNCFVDGGTVSGGNWVGGLLALNEHGTIRNCYSSGSVDGDDGVGGLAGTNDWLIEDCHSVCEVSGGSMVGGLVGWNTETGAPGSTIIKGCYSTGNVVGLYDTGGLVGRNIATIYQCYSSGNVLGQDRVGGLVGTSQFGGTGVITYCYSTGTTEGADMVGGLVGKNDYSVVTECYSIGLVMADSNSNVGGLVGYNQHSTINTSFWDIETSGWGNMCGGEGTGSTGCDDDFGKTTAQMQDPNTFLNAGWDFVGELENGPSDTWAEPNGGGYPVLWWQPFPLPPLPAFSGGTGDANDPYLISTITELRSIGHNPRLMNKHFRLIVDVDLQEANFYIIGDYAYPFSGVFDGSCRKICNLSWKHADADNVGLFSVIGTGGVVRDVRLENVDIDVTPGGHHVGALAGWNYSGTISNCHTTGWVSGYLRVGGLVGENDGVVSNCSSTGIVSGNCNFIGGLVGDNSGPIENCSSSGSVSGDWHVGGLAGHNGRDGAISYCCWTGDVTGSNKVGGLVGWNNVSGVISDSYSVGNVNGDDIVGGLVGRNDDALVANSYAATDVNGFGYSGGLTGYHDSGDYTSCFWDNTINAALGGIGNTTHPNVVGESTANMQTESTFTDAGWDFVGEVINGPNDIWLICNEGYNYPRLWWEQPRVYHVDIIDGNDNNNGLTAETAFATIQAGIDAACNEEMLQVRPGVYNESLFFINKGITVQGTDGAAVIEASGIYAVSFYTSEGPNSVLKNFVIRNSDTGIFVSNGSPTLEHLTIVDCNLGIEAQAGAGPNIRNCIFWNNSLGDLFQCQAQYSCIENGDEGMGNISEDPLFVDPNGDYHLKSEGWRWTEELVHGSHWYYDSETSRCIDAGNPGSPLGEELLSVPEDPNNVWGVNVRVNMGAYGGTTQASLAPHDWALLADLNNDGVVNFVDFTGQASEWQINGSEWRGDLNRDGVVNELDLAILAEDWLEALPWAGN